MAHSYLNKKNHGRAAYVNTSPSRDSFHVNGAIIIVARLPVDSKQLEQYVVRSHLLVI